MDQSLITKNQDQATVLELAKTKKMNLPKHVDNETRIARFYSILSYNQLVDTITKHSEYVDDEGNKSSSPKGFMLQINKLIVKLFGKPVGDMSDVRQIEAIDHIRHGIKRVIEKCEAARMPRPKIKIEVRTAAETLYQIHS